jgi:hypothetical protein
MGQKHAIPRPSIAVRFTSNEQTSAAVNRGFPTCQGDPLPVVRAPRAAMPPHHRAAS